MSFSLSPKRLLVATSGTGGHFFPALAVAGHLKDYRIDWLGVPDRLESRQANLGYPLHTTRLEGLTRGWGLFRALGSLVRSTWEVRCLLQALGIQGVFTTGGYLAAAAILAARSLGLPVILHESNVLPGKVTRWLGGWCDLVALGFPDTQTLLPPRLRTAWLGTPVRPEFYIPAPLEDLVIPQGVPLVVITGGSQGAVALNRLARFCIPTWIAAGAWVVHLTGSNDPEAPSLQVPQLITRPFFHNMAGLLQRADLVVSRAGAGALTELAVTGTPSVLIPLPTAADDHQTWNARVFAAAGAAVLLPQATLTPDYLRTRVLELLASEHQRQAMGTAAKSLAVSNSAELVSDWIRRLV